MTLHLDSRAGLRGLDPIANIDLVADPAQNFAVIMKDGTFIKGAP